MLVSACLLGINCKYSGGNNKNDKVCELAKKRHVVPVCPEQLGGLSTPRLECEIVEDEHGRNVLRKDGRDMTEQFILGAEETLKLALLLGEKEAILKSRSPSCGVHTIYDGTFSGKIIEGQGITAELLKKNGIMVYDESNYFD